jgi:hypothetical protein
MPLGWVGGADNISVLYQIFLTNNATGIPVLPSGGMST